MTQRTKERLGGLFIMAVGAGLTWFNWHIAYSEQHYYPKAAMLGPAFFVLGLGLALFPGYRTERLTRGEDLAGVSGLKLLTPRWWLILVVALVAGGCNWYLMAQLEA
jgi:ABC-type Fe3+-siderophore transport system permease subunit